MVGVIPVVATVHILGANALQNERARADSALRVELQAAGQELGQLGDDASNRADDLARSPALQHAFIAHDGAAIKRIAAASPGVVFYLGRARVAGARPPVALTRSISLTVNGRRIGTVVATMSPGLPDPESGASKVTGSGGQRPTSMTGPASWASHRTKVSGASPPDGAS